MDNQHKKPLDLDAMRNHLAGKTGQQYWRSLEELADTTEFRQILEDEFPQQARPLQVSVDRRKFLMLAGASLALAGFSGCRYLPQKKIVPYVEQPEDMILGAPMYFASSISLSGYATGVVVTSHEGRPTKLEGNPDHPASLGSLDAVTQATLLTMYDPDRAQNVMHQGEISTWDAFFHEARTNLQISKGEGLRILTQTITSPTTADQIHRLLQRYPGAKWHQYEPCGRDNVREGARLAFGQPVNTLYHFDKADRVLSLDCDFLMALPGSLKYARDFTNKRRIRTHEAGPEQPQNLAMNRLYVIESNYSITGAMADHRLPVRPSQIETVARALASKLVPGAASSSAPLPEPTASAAPLPTSASPSATLPAGVAQSWIDAVVKDLQASPRGSTLVVVGDHMPPAVHAIAHALNETLGNVGQTVTYTASIEDTPINQLASLKTLVSDMDAGQVRMLLILGGNPVYDAPSDLRFAEAFARVSSRIHLGLHDDETSALCQWHLPETHPLEAWGDCRAFDGTVSIIQPLIAPLYDGRSANEILSAFLPDTIAKEDNTASPIQSGYDIVREFWRRANNERAKALIPGLDGLSDTEFEKRFQTALHDGLFRNSAAPVQTVTVDMSKAIAPAAAAAPSQGFDLLVLPDPSVYDGRFANNGWLQELPKPITKLAWDNSALMSPATAVKLGLVPGGAEARAFEANEKMVDITAGKATVRAAVTVIPGHADDTVTLHLGYGRTKAGRLGNGIGFNAYKLRSSGAMNVVMGANVQATTETYALAHVRMAHSIEQDFDKEKVEELIRVLPIQEFAQTHKMEKSDANLSPPPGVEDGNPNDRDPNMYRLAHENEHKYEGFGAYAWGMSIDNNVCIGCNACVMACQSENNIPIVGKDEIRRGRDMLWLRIDTYYRGDYKNPASFFEPVPCMHCELAPCEPVCPVAATVHSKEGLNMQVYNRCVGTKYCSNNCPYKVRRFNFYKYTAGQPDPDKLTTNYDNPVLKLSANPDVTIRGRGVMEKCTYCVQRINAARIEAKKAERELHDGEVVTACQQACPTSAIVFGNILDKNSAVSKLKAQPHDYTLLADLNTRPRTTYLARLQNLNPDLASTETKRE